MVTFINVRGTNGSGKTTGLRKLVLDSDGYRVEPTICQTDKDTGKPKGKPIPVTILANGVALLGDYTPEAANRTTAGCDRISRQEDTKNILKHIATLPGVRVVLFEGIIVSTLFSGWQEFAEQVRREGNHQFIWAFLDTPLEDCLRRVQERNGGKPVDTKQISDKWRSIDRVKQKAGEARLMTATINWVNAVESLKNIINTCGAFYV